MHGSRRCRCGRGRVQPQVADAGRRCRHTDRQTCGDGDGDSHAGVACGRGRGRAPAASLRPKPPHGGRVAGRCEKASANERTRRSTNLQLWRARQARARGGAPAIRARFRFVLFVSRLRARSARASSAFARPFARAPLPPLSTHSRAANRRVAPARGTRVGRARASGSPRGFWVVEAAEAEVEVEAAGWVARLRGGVGVGAGLGSFAGRRAGGRVRGFACSGAAWRVEWRTCVVSVFVSRVKSCMTSVVRG